MTEDKKKPNISITPRDREVMHQVFLHRFMEAKQIQRAIDPSFHGGAKTWNYPNLARRLKLLADHGYLHLPPSQPQYTEFKHGGGSFPLVYSLGAKGARILCEEPYSIPLERFSVNADNRARSPQIRHTLLTTEIVVRLQEDCRNNGLRFYDQSQLIQTLSVPGRKTLRSGTRGWTVPALPPFTPEVTSIIPDRMCAFDIPAVTDGSNVFYFFIEADTGDEQIVSSKLTTSTPIRKVRQYRATAKGRVLRDHFRGIENFIVLFVTSNDTRAQNILRECQKVEGGWKNVWITDVDNLLNTPFLKIPWQEGKNAGQVTLERVVRNVLERMLSQDSVRREISHHN